MIEQHVDLRRRQSLADGVAGTVLFHLERGDDCRDWLREMLAGPVLAHPEQATLFDGAPAIAFTLASTEHRRALSTLDGHIDTVIRIRLYSAHRRIDRGETPTKSEFDLIAGITGFGTYLLRRHGGGVLLREVLAYLVRLTDPLPDGLPGWWATNGPTGPDVDWQGGHGNLGLSHGISGPLALLALAMRRDVIVDGHATAMDRICRWLDRWRCGTGHRAWWPGWISRAEYEAGVVHQHGPQRPSWCYGTPGLARAQQLVGLALGDTRRQRFAEQVLAWCLSDEAQLAQLTDVSICHGWSGLLHTVWRMGEHEKRLLSHLPRILNRLDERLFRPSPSAHGLLEGDAGVRLAQHAATTNTPPVTQWDACLLLDG